MPEKATFRVCPYLGLKDDFTLRFVEPHEAHICHSPVKWGPVSLKDQTDLCFSSDFALRCPLFVRWPNPTLVTTPPALVKEVQRRKKLATLQKRLQITLLGLAVILALIAGALVWDSFQVEPQRAAVALALPTATPTLTSTPASATPIPSAKQAPALLQANAAARPTLSPVSIPPAPANGVVLSLAAASDRTGWVSSKETTPHWNEPSLFAGTRQNAVYTGIVQFDLSSLAPGSKIVYALLELTGRDGSQVGGGGNWQVELIEPNWGDDLTRVSFDQVKNARTIAPVGNPIPATDLATGYINRFELDAGQRDAVERLLVSSYLTFRVRGPASPEDGLFAWDAGSNDSTGGPTLYLVAIPADFTVVTRTPTPGNVVTAAAVAAQGTARARQFGTATPLPRVYVTATSVPEQGRVVITNVPTPASTQAATATALYATAVAMTTGTYTPTPANWVTATPIPLLIPESSVTPINTPMPPKLGTLELARQALPPGFYNKIAFLVGRNPASAWVMDADGSNVSLLTDRNVYDIAKARDSISPDGNFFVHQGPDISGQTQLFRDDLHHPDYPSFQLTFVKRGIPFGESWAPDGNHIAYVSDESGPQQIWVYTLEPKSWKRLTTWDAFWNQFPSWSPDGKQIVFSSDHGHGGTFSEIWVMNADGSNPRLLGNGVWDAYAPVWIRWKK